MAKFWLSLLLVFSCASYSDGQTVIRAQTRGDLSWLTQEERDWLKEHPRLRVAPTPDYPPFEYWDDGGQFQGVVRSYLEHFSAELGVEFELVRTREWKENLEKLEQREIDAVSLIVPWSDRDYVSVSQAYITYPSLIFVRKDVPGKLGLEDLAKRRVAVPNDYTGEFFLRTAHPEIEVVEANSPAHGIRMVATGEAFAYFGGMGVVAFTAEKEGISSLRPAGESDFQYANGFGVRSDWSPFARIVSKTLERMTRQQHREFHARWVTADIFERRFYEARQFWWGLGTILSILFAGWVGVLIWNRRQAAFIEQLEIEKQKTLVVNEKLERARLDAEAANQAKGAFLANISHEIRTPMNGVIGMCELLAGTRLTSQQREYLRFVTSSAEGLLTVINDILDFSKIEAGKLELKPEPFSVESLIEDVVGIMQVQAEAKGLHLFVSQEEGVSPFYIGDNIRIRQILINLLSNAIKFTDRGHVDVKISVAERLGEEHVVRFEVKDTGIGISSENIATIFEPFEQEDSSATRRFGGTGLGLTICKALAEMMGGTANARSQLGRGSEFWFTVRMSPADSIGVTHADRTWEIPAEKKRVLLAEDGLVNQRVAIGLLECRGHQVDLATTGREALAALERQSYDVVLMDIQMPDMDGLTAVKKIREIETETGRHQKIVAMTAHAMTGDRERFLEAGMDDHLSKPFRPQELYAVVELDNESEAVPDESASAGEAQVWDRNSALQATGGNQRLANELIEICLEETPRILQAARDAVGREDLVAVCRSGHSMKSGFRTIGAKLAAQAAEKLEFANTDHQAQVEQALREVADRFEELKTTLQEQKLD